MAHVCRIKQQSLTSSPTTIRCNQCFFCNDELLGTRGALTMAPVHLVDPPLRSIGPDQLVHPVVNLSHLAFVKPFARKSWRVESLINSFIGANDMGEIEVDIIPCRRNLWNLAMKHKTRNKCRVCCDQVDKWVGGKLSNLFALSPSSTSCTLALNIRNCHSLAFAKFFSCFFLLWLFWFVP